MPSRDDGSVDGVRLLIRRGAASAQTWFVQACGKARQYAFDPHAGAEPFTRVRTGNGPYFAIIRRKSVPHHVAQGLGQLVGVADA